MSNKKIMKFLLTILFLLLIQFVFAQPKACDCPNADTIKLSCFNSYDISSIATPNYFSPEIYKEIICTKLLDSVASFLLEHPNYDAWVEVHIDTLSFKHIFDSIRNKYIYSEEQRKMSEQTCVNAYGYATAILKCLQMSGVKNIRNCTGHTASIDSCPDNKPCYKNYIIYCPNNLNKFKILKKDSILKLENIFFDSGGSQLLPKSFNELNDLYEFLKIYQKIKIEISGHTDNTGDITSNQKLSENRSKSVADYLIKKGISSTRIVSKGYGDTKPIADNSTEEGRSKNRRVEIKIIE